MKKLVLASQSPRRYQLLAQLGLDFTVLASNVKESVPSEMEPAEAARQLAELKAQDVADRITERSDRAADHLVLGADTIVILGNRVLGKPRNEEEACEMLALLSRKTHRVITAYAVVAIAGLSRQVRVGHTETLVKMRDLSAEQIRYYVASGEPMDKAGSYGIQEKGSLLVEGVQGCYFNVVGLPIGDVAQVLEAFGYEVWSRLA